MTYRDLQTISTTRANATPAMKMIIRSTMVHTSNALPYAPGGTWVNRKAGTV